MKRIGIIWIVVLMLAVAMFASCSSGQVKTYDKEFTFTSPDKINDDLLTRVDLSYRDLNLTKDELDAIRKYSKYGNVLRAATYYWPGKNEQIEYEKLLYDLGVDNFELLAIAQIMGINIEIESLELEEALAQLDRGQIDMIPGIYPSDETEGKGYLMEHGTPIDFIYAYSLDNTYIDDITDLDDLRIGIVSGLNVIDENVQASLSEANVNYQLNDSFSTQEDALAALKNDDIDIILQTFSRVLISEGCHSVNVSQIFDEYASTILFTSKNDDIQHIMTAIDKMYHYNDYMQSLKQDYMDHYAAMVVSSGLAFTLKERIFIFNLKENPINVLVFDDSDPFIYYDPLNGTWAGISYEIWDAVANATQINYNIVESDLSCNDFLQAVHTETYEDEFSAVIPLYISQDKKDDFIFSDVLVIDKFVVVGLSDSESLYEIYDLANTEVGIVEGLDSTKALKNYLPHEDYINDYQNTDQLVADLDAGLIDYIVLSESEFNEYFYERRFYDLSIKYEISDAESAIGFLNDPDGERLQAVFNKVLPFIKPDQIVEEFSSVDTDITEVMTSRSRDMLFMFGFMFLVVVGFLSFFLRRMAKANRQVREIAFVNSITGLQNRTAFYNENTLATGSLIYVDIDNFKRLNDVYGHDIGDMYAFEIAQRISAIADEYGLMAYTMDIDSFLLLDDATNSEDKLVSISAKILYEVTKNVRIYDVDHKMTASIGIAVLKDEKGMEELFKKVDTALFLAKERGKNRYVIASEEEFFTHRKKQFLNDALTQETIQKEIEPYYQPKVDIRDGRVIGVEALARWNAKEQGMIYPDEILPILEENDMLPILDISILTKACKHYVDWLDRKLIDKSFIISCNMSYMTIEKFDIVAAVNQIHDNIGMPYRSLEIEIREEDFVNNLNVMHAKLIELAKLGINISIDNFKADRTIMTRMSKLPINVIKMDRDILKDGITNKVREMFELISTLTRRLNIGLIIQGIETPEQIQLLKEIPIYRVQGFYYSEAVSAEKVENDLRVKYIYR